MEKQGSNVKILNGFVTEKLKLTYQHRGKRMANLPNGKKKTYVLLLLENDAVVNPKRLEDIPVDPINTLVNEEFVGEEVVM